VIEFTEMVFEDRRATVRELWRSLDCAGAARPLRELLNTFGSVPDVFAVGGFPRDVLLSRLRRRRTQSKDIDLVIDTENLSSAMADMQGEVTRTPLGGYRWIPLGSAIPIDVWQLADTIWIDEYRLPVTIDAFLSGVDLNVDRIAIGLHDGSVTDKGFMEAVRSSEIRLDASIRVDWLRNDEIARALMASYKTGFPVGTSLAGLNPAADFAARAWQRLRGDGYSDHDIASALDAVA
jgi:hypothetical protein